MTQPGNERADEDAVAQLTGIARAGRLAEDFDVVTKLAARLSRADLSRVGPLLARVDAAQVRAAHPDLPEVSVAVTGAGTVGALTAPVAAELVRHGLVPRCSATGYDAYLAELADPGSALHDADIAVCLLDARVVFAEVPTPWRVEQVEEAATRVVTRIVDIVERFVERSRGMLVVTTMPLLRSYPAQLVDHRSRARLGAVWARANARLLDLGERAGVVVLNLDPLLAEGVPAVDRRMGVHLGLRHSPALLAAVAREIGHLARNVAGRTRKCLVLDLDDTLWSGVLGEVGPDGVEVGPAFADVQRAARQLGSQGVLLAVASKNDPEPVRTALAKPEMALRADDFVRVSASWRPKPETLAGLAEELNLGQDSLVFADDSAAECGMVATLLPQVAVVELAGDPAGHLPALLADGWFDVPRLTDEDRGRSAAYRADLHRRELRTSAGSLDEYLRTLGVRVELAPAALADVARLSQLTLRTNQFTMTTARLSPPEVEALIRNPEALVLAVRTADRFGHNGLVGAVFGRHDAGLLWLENVLLSCRVFGRGIEQAYLSSVLSSARARGVGAVLARYVPSARNGAFADFYLRHGFTRVLPYDGPGELYRHDLGRIPSVPEHIVLTVSSERPAA
ncbi:HAD-IIIC family phosphatase [Micromonospora sp. KC207]|uniref:HAD-IIIC family phosphatase n=1 Tax=Micromonospora sp. KC207 TaxID=2530377 RepID=UPI0010516EC9|nr:HAD-IIIC family phosphatase [Micromonospora sp. KC207]TDC60098.1 HAD-IIIC family phosphatase [Micromonospora sp. KC207]